MNVMQMLGEHKVIALKKMMYQFLQDRYGKNDQIIERIGHALPTQGDLEAFVKLCVDCYEMGYTRSVNDHRDQLEKLGITVKVVAS